MTEAVTISGVRVTSPDKILFPEQGLTKRDLADYYGAVANVMLPHVAYRPISLVRCPQGRERSCFFQRHAGSGIPEAVHEIAIPGFDEPYLYITDLAGLVSLVQIGTLEIHPWGSRIDRPDRPDRLVLDLDPGEGVAFAEVVQAALDVRERLARLKLTSVAKTTGGKGLHVVVPIDRRTSWAEAKAFAREFAEAMAADAPERFLTRISKAERKGRIFIDYLRNDPTSTAIAPYATRNRKGAPVATPIAWEEVRRDLDPALFTVATVPARIAAIGDPWCDLASVRQRLPAAAKRAGSRSRQNA